MLCSRSEVFVCLLMILGSVLVRSNLGNPQELELSALRTHKQLLQAEIARLFLEQPLRAETQLLLEDLQLRDHQIGVQIEKLEEISKGETTQRLAINLTADFEHLQHKLDDLKRQLELLDGRFASQGKQLEGHSSEGASPAGPGLGSFLWGPLLTMPEFPQGSVASDQQHNHHQQDHSPDPQQDSSPSIIKRVLDMLRPSIGVSGLRSRWTESAKSAATGLATPKPTHPLSAEELLPQLQEQRRFLDDAITRLELLAVKKGSNKN
uniref:EG:22E5.6 protein n=1 Tax=Drosophila melanogaster TaxID=7227 RepID=O77265_DROME|nr:EG:22E5.6 [Drosophila melanogaster]